MDPEVRFRLLAGMALVDAHLDASEQEVLLRCARGLGLPRERAAGIVREIMQGGAVGAVEPPSDPGERARLFQDLVAVVTADGQVTPQEQGTLQALAPGFGISPAQVPGIVQAAAGGAPPPVPGAAPPPPPPPGGGKVSLAAPGARERPRATTGEASCPSCGAPVAFRNARSVAVVCEYCDTTVVRDDRSGDLRDLGKVSHVVPDASPIRIGATGTCFGVAFEVIGRLQIEHPTGYWNEWFLQWADGQSGWLGEALGQYLVTFPAQEGEAKQGVPRFEELRVGQRLFLDKKRWVVTEARVARATGTQGETPFVVEQGYELPYADLRRADEGFATIDYSEETPLVFTGRCVGWKHLGMRNHRRFDGWD